MANKYRRSNRVFLGNLSVLLLCFQSLQTSADYTREQCPPGLCFHVLNKVGEEVCVGKYLTSALFVSPA